MVKQTFTKQERLSGKIAINRLFNAGHSFFLYPYLIYYIHNQIPAKDSVGCRFLVSVSKKKHKHAVKRNQIKRRIKEAIRLNKPEISAACNNKYYDFGVVYVSTDVMPYDFLASKLLKAFKNFSEISHNPAPEKKQQ